PLQVLPVADLFHPQLRSSRTLGLAVRRERFGPFPSSLWSFPPPLDSEGQRLLELVLLPLVAHRVLRPTRRSLLFVPSALRPTMPCADSRSTVRMNCSILNHGSVTCCRSPAVSSTAFRAQPPDLPAVLLVDMDFAITCSLVPHRRPHHLVLVHRFALLIHP